MTVLPPGNVTFRLRLNIVIITTFYLFIVPPQVGKVKHKIDNAAQLFEIFPAEDFVLNSARLQHPSSIHRRISPDFHRRLPPILRGLGSLPLLFNLNIVRLLRESIPARVSAESKGSLVARLQSTPVFFWAVMSIVIPHKKINSSITAGKVYRHFGVQR